MISTTILATDEGELGPKANTVRVSIKNSDIVKEVELVSFSLWCSACDLKKLIGKAIGPAAESVRQELLQVQTLHGPRIIAHQNVVPQL